MKTIEEIDALMSAAVEAGLDGLDFMAEFDYDQLADGYNGIGPEFLPAGIRLVVSKFLHIFAPAAFGHDLRNELSDGTRVGFCAANEEFLRNCIKLAAYYCKDDYKRRVRAVSAAIVLYEFVSSERFGWRAWLEAQERHAEKLSSGNSVWNTTKNKPQRTEETGEGGTRTPVSPALCG